jgi:hypothetical protein
MSCELIVTGTDIKNHSDMMKFERGWLCFAHSMSWRCHMGKLQLPLRMLLPSLSCICTMTTFIQRYDSMLLINLMSLRSWCRSMVPRVLPAQ